MNLDLGPKRQRATDEFSKQIAHLPRSQRRRLKSEWSLSKKSGRAHWRRLLDNQGQTIPQEFPFNLLSSQFVLDWIVGDRSDEDFRERLVEVLNDTKGLIERVLDLTEERHTIYGLLRNEGENFLSRIERSLEPILAIIDQLIEAGKFDEIAKTLRHSVNTIDFRRIIVSHYANTPTEQMDDRTIVRIIDACPAAFTFASLYSAYAHSMVEANLQRWQQGKRSVVARKRSDFGDLMHATYAPYCDIFRCDAYFASLLRRNLKIKHVIADRSRLVDLN